MTRSPAEPFLNMRFRVEIDALRETGVAEVVFPQARLVRGRSARYGTLSLRRGVGHSTDWHGWWEEARTARRTPARTVTVTLLDESGAIARRWRFDDARPVAYSLSNLDALGNEVLMETLELAVGSFEEGSGGRPTARNRVRR